MVRKNKKHLLLIVLVGTLIGAGLFRSGLSKAVADSQIIRSGDSGFCLDDYKNGLQPGNQIDLWGCNDSLAQSWAYINANLMHHNQCLSVQRDAQALNTAIVLGNCANQPGQIWLRSGETYFNPNSNLCLSGAGERQQLVLQNCNNSTQEQWSDPNPNPTCEGSERQKVVCNAEKQWTLWQSGTANHNNLLNIYTDGQPYEAWCADFVSYVYKLAGYPFSQAYDGWDENNANNLQDYNFSLHMAGSGYVPQPGDIAFFNYTGGHVEVVVSGGQTPTFIYGNSATVDPTTGNGQMKANTITKDGPQGQLLYFLSPN